LLTIVAPGVVPLGRHPLAPAPEPLPAGQGADQEAVGSSPMSQAERSWEKIDRSDDVEVGGRIDGKASQPDFWLSFEWSHSKARPEPGTRERQTAKVMPDLDAEQWNA
jgi:hypothetical protein